jgi:hypothetical protein
MALDFDEDIDWDEIFCARDTEDASEVIPTDSDSDLDVDYNPRDIESGREDSEEEVGPAIQLQRTQLLRENLQRQGKDVAGPIRQVLTAMDEAGIDLTILLDGVSWAVFYSPPRVSMESSWSPQVLMESSWSPHGVLIIS